jgi:probable HAF family extracellular repeat protein
MTTLLISHRIAVLGLALGITLAAQQPAYTPIDYPKATITTAYGINPRGQIVGVYTSNGKSHGYLLSGGNYSTIDLPGMTTTYAYGINDRGDIVGSYSSEGLTHGFLLKDGKMTTIDFPGSTATEVLGITADGELVGDYSLTSLTPCCAAGTHGFLYSNGKYTTIDFPGNGTLLTYASGIDPDGGIAGSYSDGNSHGFLLKDGKYTSIDYPNTTTTFMNALGVNARGEIVGRYQDGAGRHAYVLSAGHLSAIDIPGASLSAGTAIDPQGNILGQYRAADGNTHGFLLRTEGPRYSVTDLGLQGAIGGPFELLNNGLISGSAPVAGGAVHASLWYNGLGPIDIGTPGLGGPNSVAFDVNESGVIVGGAETATANDADFCGFKGAGVSPGKVCLPFMFQNGVMTTLATLGGKNAYATAVNSMGQPVGLSETTTADANSSCPSNVFKPVAWQNGVPKQLPTSGTDIHGAPFKDANGFAYGINDAGQMVGASGECFPGGSPNGTALLPHHALFWDADGTVHDMGNLGGGGQVVPSTGNFAVHINNHGQVVGSSDIAGDEFAHAFSWTKATGMQDLGTLAGDQQSGGIWVNEAGDIVGVSVSFDGGFYPRAFLWTKSTGMLDLNSRIPADSKLYLMFGDGVNSRGEIIATAFNSEDNEMHSVLLTPIHSLAALGALGATRPLIIPRIAQKTLDGRMRRH